MKQDDLLRRRSFLWMGGSALFVAAMGLDKFPIVRPSIPKGPKTLYWTGPDRALWNSDSWALSKSGIAIPGLSPGPQDTAILAYGNVVLPENLVLGSLEICGPVTITMDGDVHLGTMDYYGSVQEHATFRATDRFSSANPCTLTIGPKPTYLTIDGIRRG